jgi:acylphosphatase
MKHMKNVARVQIIVSGEVQGVFFRRDAKDMADRLALFGIVKNLPNGDVEIIAEGEKEDLEALEMWADGGSTHAKVTHRETVWSEPTGEYSSFRIDQNLSTSTE